MKNECPDCGGLESRVEELELECDALTYKLECARDERDAALSEVDAMRETPYLRRVQ